MAGTEESNGIVSNEGWSYTRFLMSLIFVFLETFWESTEARMQTS